MSENENLEPKTPKPTPQQSALRQAVDEIEMTASRLGWDRPPALYALVRTEEMIENEAVPADIRAGLEKSWNGTADHLSAVAQDPMHEDEVEDVLPRLAWPESVYGAVLTLERIIVPPEVEDEAPEDPEEALTFISNHPSRTDVRLIVGVTRDGESWCEVRARNFDDPTRVGKGENLAPSLVEALKIGFIPDEEIASSLDTEN